MIDRPVRQEQANNRTDNKHTITQQRPQFGFMSSKVVSEEMNEAAEVESLFAVDDSRLES
jgi:hypothetical protein